MSTASELSPVGQADPQAFVRQKANRCDLDLLVQGAVCAGCISRIESGLREDDRVSAARLNLSTGRLSLSWTGDRSAALGFVSQLERMGYPATAYQPETGINPKKQEERRLMRALAVAGFAMANVMLLSVSVWSGEGEMSASMEALMHRLSALIVLPTVAFSGRPFFVSAWAALRAGHVNMDVPISLAVLLATALSVYETFIGHGETYFDAAVMLLFFLLIGRFLDMRLRARAGEAAQSLASMQVATANRVLPGGRVEAVPARDVRPGDRLMLAAGDRVPVDGDVVEGCGLLDGSLVTGETAPITASVGTRLHSGVLNLDSPLIIEAVATRDDSLLAEITRLVEAGEQSRSRYVKLADQAARLYVPVVHGLAALTLVGWLLVTGDPRAAIINAIAVLIITCPCALGLAVPAVQIVATGQLFRKGVLVKSGDALERLAAVDTVVFDKTGTLTEGRPKLIAPEGLPSGILDLAAQLARTSRHPISRAIADAAGMGDTADDIHEDAGGGLSGHVDGTDIRLGSARWLGCESSSEPFLETWFQRGDEAPVRMQFEDQLRDSARQTVQSLKDQGLHVELLSGDRETPVGAIASEIGIDHWQANLKPQDKIARLKELETEGRHVLMIGDGINDAPALAAAHVSISLASAAEISQSAADMVLRSNDLTATLLAYKISVKAKRRVLENFALAAGYNVIAVPLAVTGMVTPLIAAIAMSASSLIVTLNALRLTRS